MKKIALYNVKNQLSFIEIREKKSFVLVSTLHSILKKLIIKIITIFFINKRLNDKNSIF